MNGELSQIRRAILDHEVPVMLDVEEAAIALDMSVTAARNRFADWSVCGDRYMVRAAEVRAALRAMRPAKAPPAAAVRPCLSCRGPLPVGSRRSRRFCSKRCSEMTLTARAALASKSASENSRVSAGIDGPPSARTGKTLGGSVGGYPNLPRGAETHPARVFTETAL
jgi:endogenous inhibitor of DNA gyrase (YacG/DUF329 family)